MKQYLTLNNVVIAPVGKLHINSTRLISYYLHEILFQQYFQSQIYKVINNKVNFQYFILMITPIKMCILLK